MLTSLHPGDYTMNSSKTDNYKQCDNHHGINLGQWWWIFFSSHVLCELARQIVVAVLVILFTTRFIRSR